MGKTKIEMFVEVALQQARMERASYDEGDNVRLIYEGRVKALEDVFRFLRAKEYQS